MNVSKKFFLVGALLCLALVGRSQSFTKPAAQNGLLKEACGNNLTLPFSMPTLRLETEVESVPKLTCNYAMGLSFPQEIADELKSFIGEATDFKQVKSLRCDYVQPLDLKALFNEKEQQGLNKLINETFHK